MLVVELSFLAGRFHATPWGRHVNEGVPEWPPSPYRLLRALIDVWKRKRPDWPASRVEPLLAALASSPPNFHLPPAAPSHVRSFLSENKKDTSARQLVFDAFAVVDPCQPVLIGWPGIQLTDKARADLDELLSLVNYFGRSESWVTARIWPAATAVEWNCTPEDVPCRIDDPETLAVACTVAPESYTADPNRPLIREGTSSAKRNKKVSATVVSWLDALAWSTAELLSAGRSEPPALTFVSYQRSRRSLDVAPRRRTRRREPLIQGVLYALESKVSPSVVETLEVAERFRRKLMGIHKAIVGDPAKVSPLFSGKDLYGNPSVGHRHAYFLPLDQDRDGQLDHLLVVCKDPLPHAEQLALDRLNSLWQPRGRPDIRLTPIQWGRINELLQPARRFASVTPFVPPRHYRRGRGEFADWLTAEIRREAANHGLPEPTLVESVPWPQNGGGRRRRWLEFRRSRKEDTARLGYGLELQFSDPVLGPVALGYGCHFGLGLFAARDA